MLALLIMFSVITSPPAIHQQGGEKYILISLSDQMLYCFEGTEKVMEFRVSTGRKGIETPTGEVRIQRKKMDMTGIDGKIYHYALQIWMYDPKMKKERRLNIHESGKVPNFGASSGCVRTLIGEGRKVYDWAEVGTLVIIQDDWPDCLL